MSNTVIRVENLSKAYRLGQIGTGRLVDDLRVWWAKTRGKPNPLLKIGEKEAGNRDGETIWALKDVSFDVQQGEVLGIIGRNGAGKSTLLKILSRVTAPTSGQVKVKGRIASLLEVGTGFHPDLTGKENIYLNGAILGMSRREITSKFDEIVAFAEIEKFVDTPVKRYSSGMYVRLAFAVAAHLDPEILLVDEVLAVGDAEFQKKCLGKMGDVAKEGRTVLFVSHNTAAITRLCPRTVLIHTGFLGDDGNSAQVVTRYLQGDGGPSLIHEWSDLSSAPGDEAVRLNSVRVLDENGQISDVIDIRRPIRLEMKYKVIKPDVALRPWIKLWNDNGVCVFSATDTDMHWTTCFRSVGNYISVVNVPGNFLAEGIFSVTIGIAHGGSVGDFFIVNDAVSFHIIDPFEGDSARGQYGGSFEGIVRPKLNWITTFLH